MALLLFLLCWSLCNFIVVSVPALKFRSDAYPKSIPKYEIRIDVYTKKPVVSGLVHTLPLRSTLVNFKRHLQCATKDGNMNYNNGLVSRMRLSGYTSQHVKSFCSFAELKCLQWEECLRNIPKAEAGTKITNHNPFNAINGWSIAELLRVINSTLYYDWAWGAERLDKDCMGSPVSPLVNATLSRISDMRDSAFFTGGADPGLFSQVTIPFMSHCTHENYADMLVPWINMFSKSLIDYRKLREANSNFTEESYQEIEPGYKPWDEKVPKAALFTSTMPHRVFYYDQARLYPDLIDSLNTYYLDRSCFYPWNPTSTEVCNRSEHRTWPTPEEMTEYMKLPPGYAAPLFNVCSNHYTTYHPASYKYVVVPLGMQSVLSTSARIIHVMFYSGAVAILPRTSWIFHFQAQLQPWVHYVPISFTGADLAEKVQWLKEHDDLARQIAENGRNFARSFMRLEDYYCYTAHWLDMLGELSSMSDVAKVTFRPRKYLPRCDKPEQFDFPV